MATFQTPLTEQNLKQIKDSLEQLDHADELIAKARQVGMDMTSQAQQVQEQRTKLMKWKQTFFPGQA